MDLIYILGYPHSGTTLISNIIGADESCFNAGEVEELWLDFREDLSFGCGCKKRVHDCEIWREVFETTNDFLQKDGYDDFNTLLGVCAREPFKPNFEFRSNFYKSKYTTADLKAFKHMLFVFYTSIQKVTGAKYIIDSSKSISYLKLLLSMQDINVHIVHIIRDPRGVLNSNIRKLRLIPERLKRARKIFLSGSKVVLDWNLFNLKAHQNLQAHPNYNLIKYDDFIRQPKLLEKILRKRLEVSIPFSDKGEIDLPVNHTLKGNRSRFKYGPIQLKEDLKWQYQLPKILHQTVKLVSLPVTKYFEGVDH